jgi:hypothetical protein
MIEQMIQLFWTQHRCAFDFDHKFCDAHARMRDIEIKAKERGGSVPATATLDDGDNAAV